MSVILAKENFFSFFTFPLKSGDLEAALDIPNKAVIDETTASRLFPKRNALGETLKINGIDYTVSGVMFNIPRNSHLQANIVIPVKNSPLQSAINNTSCITYHKIAKGANITALEQAFTLAAHEKFDYLKNIDMQIKLEPLKDIHFKRGIVMGDRAVTGSETEVMVFISVAAVILLLSCINFTNLFVSNSFLRAKSIGIKQVMGAHRSTLRKDFYFETACYTAISLAVGLYLATVLTPVYNQYTHSTLFIDYASVELYIFLVALFVVVVLAAGSMPAFKIARLNPVETIKGKYRGQSMSVLQKGLTIVQFTASITLLLITLLINHQVNFMLNQDIGFNKENIVYAFANLQSRDQYETLRNELMKEPSVMDVTLKNALPTVWGAGAPTKNIGDEKATPFECGYVKSNYLDMMGMQFIEGENPFGKYEGSLVCVLNETAVRLLGLENPIDQTILLMENPAIVKGVIRDAQVRSFHKSTDPQVYVSMDYMGNRPMYAPVMFKIAGDPKKAITAIEKQWKTVLPNAPFECNFLDDEFAKMYASEGNLRNVLLYTMFIGFAISVAGLFAMAFYVTQRRRKEIAIRKVHGASIMDLLRLLNKSFMLWILISYILGSIVTFVFMKMFWLKSFIVQAPLSIGIFAGVGVVAFAVALLTVSWQTWSAATTNPVEVINKEQ
jgi:putative ABC transport system permease protein